MEQDIAFFINDKYLILKTFLSYEKKRSCSLSQNDLVEITGFSKFKINLIVNELIENGYLNYLGRKKYSITNKSRKVVDFLENKY